MGYDFTRIAFKTRVEQEEAAKELRATSSEAIVFETFSHCLDDVDLPPQPRYTEFRLVTRMSDERFEEIKARGWRAWRIFTPYYL